MSNYLKSFEECLDVQLKEAYSKGLLSESKDFIEKIKDGKDIESILLIILSAFSKIDSEIYTDIQRVADSYDVDKAKGLDLDNLGLLVGIPRPRSTHSLVFLTFKMEGVGSDLILPPGVIVSSSKGVNYVTQEEIVFISDKIDQSIDVLAVSEGTGTSQNVDSYELNIIHVDALPHQLKVTNVSKSYGGLEPATDEEYRTYLKNWHKIHQSGNLWAYTNFFRNYDGLVDYILLPQWDGAGTLKIMIDCDDKLEQYHISRINDALDEIAFSDEDVVIERSPAIDIDSPVHIKITTHSNYTSAFKEELINTVKRLVHIYVNGGFVNENVNGENKEVYVHGLGIGGSFIPFRLAVFIDKHIGKITNIDEIKILSPDDIVKISPYAVLKVGKIEVDVD